MTNMNDAFISRGEAAVQSLAGMNGRAVRDNLFEAARGLMAARQKYPADQDFHTWLRSSIYSNLDTDEQDSLIMIGEYEVELRPLVEGSTLSSARAIWQQFKIAAGAIRSRNVPNPMSDISSCDDTPGLIEQIDGVSVAPDPDIDQPDSQIQWEPPKTRPKTTTKLVKILDSDAEYLYGWFSTDSVRQTLSPLASENRGRPMLKTVVEAVKDGSCRHAKVATMRRFDVRMAFPHLPQQFAHGMFGGKRPLTIYKAWSRLTELNAICADRSSYTVETDAPNGTYLLRIPEHEREIDRVAHQWWQTQTLPGVNQEPAEIDQAFVDSFPNLPEGTRELVFHGARVWPYENETISFEDACNTYRFVQELHGMLQAMLKSDKPGQAIKIRHYGKWMRRLSAPSADMMFRMASAISQNPDKEFVVKPPPLEVSYGE